MGVVGKGGTLPGNLPEVEVAGWALCHPSQQEVAVGKERHRAWGLDAMEEEGG